MSLWDAESQRQYELITHSAAWIEVGSRTELEILGRDCLRVMNNLCTADLRHVQPGQGTETFVLGVKGNTLGHAGLFVGEGRVFLSTVADQAQALIPHFRQYIVSEVVDFVDRSAESATFLLAGPEAGQQLAGWGVASNLEPRLSHSREILAASDALIRRTDLLGADGFQLVVGPESRSTIVDHFARAGIPQCSWNVLESIRVEQRVPRFGADIDVKNLPQEIGRDNQAISFAKGCYLGQETVARLDALGHVNRHLVLLTFAGREAPPAGFVIEQEGKPAVRITSSAWSPRYNSPLAFGFVRHGLHQPGTQFATRYGVATITEPDPP